MVFHFPLCKNTTGASDLRSPGRHMKPQALQPNRIPIHPLCVLRINTCPGATPPSLRPLKLLILSLDRASISSCGVFFSDKIWACSCSASQGHRLARSHTSFWVFHLVGNLSFLVCPLTWLPPILPVTLPLLVGPDGNRRLKL